MLGHISNGERLREARTGYSGVQDTVKGADNLPAAASQYIKDIGWSQSLHAKSAKGMRTS